MWAASPKQQHFCDCTRPGAGFAWFISWCFELSQLLGVTSGLKSISNFTVNMFFSFFFLRFFPLSYTHIAYFGGGGWGLDS